MKHIPIALQLYSIREDAQKDLAGVLQQVVEMGYEGVEFAGFYGHEPQAVRRMLDDTGLKVAGTHTGLDALLGDAFDETVEANKAIGNRYVVVPGLRAPRRESRADLLDTVKLFDELAEKLEGHGMQIGYHNHTVEFEPVDGDVPWDVLFGAVRPDVVMQLDIGHALRAGADPVKVLEKYPGRAKTVHVKDYSPQNDKALVGEGNVAWDEVFKRCETTAETEWYIIEQESYPVSPLESVEKCVQNLKELLGR